MLDFLKELLEAFKKFFINCYDAFIKFKKVDDLKNNDVKKDEVK